MTKQIPAFFLFCCITSLQAQSFIMADQFHGSDSQINSSVTADAAGNIYTTCNFWANVDADPGPATVNYTAAGTMDIALIKLNSAGNFIWGAHIGGTGFESASVVKTDPSGNVFIFGYFNGTIDMDPTVATYNLVSAGSDDLFCAKYDPSGNLLWATNIGGTGTEQNYGMDLDAAGNVIINGYFQNTVDFDPGPGVHNLTSAYSTGDFLLKLSGTGNFVWVKNLGTFWGNSTILDNADNIYITGEFWGVIDFDPGAGVYNLSAFGFGADAVTMKFDNAGNFIWASAFTASVDEQGYALAVNETEQTVVIGGMYQATLDADPGPGVANLISAGYTDAFVVKLNAVNGSYIWSKNIGGLGYQSVLGLQIDATGNIHMTGPLAQTADFDPGVGVTNLTSAGAVDVFRTVWSTTGNYISAERIGGTGDDWPATLQLDNVGTEIIAGDFDATVDFDPGIGVHNLNTAFTGWDGFVAKYCTSYTINNNVAICNGDSYFAGGALQTTAGDYYDYYTPAFGCDSTVITHLTVNTPVVDLGADAGICSGTTLTLDAENTGATYLWNTGATTQTINITTAGTYSVTITDGAGCIASDAVSISVNPSPLVNLGPDISACAGETITLNAANPGATYLWNTGATTQTIHPVTSGNYSVTVTNGFGCTDNDLIHVTFNALPVVDLGPDAGFCSGAGITLDAENTGADFVWNTGANTQTIYAAAGGIYGVTVTNAAGCVAGDSVLLTEYPQPIVDLGADMEICEGEAILLDAGNPGNTYLWNTGATTQTITATSTGNYSVIVTTPFGCSDNDLIHLMVHPLPTVDLGGTVSFCEGTSVLLDAENAGSDYVWNTGATTQQITIETGGDYSVTVTTIYGCSASATVTASTLITPVVDAGPDQSFCDGNGITLDATIPFESTYAWNTGATTATISITEGGTYIVTATNIYGCSDTDTVLAELYPLPIVDITLPVSEICSDAAPMVLTGGTPAEGIWSGDGITDSTFDPTAAGLGDHMIFYSYTNDLGCTASASAILSVTICQAIQNQLNTADLLIYPNPATGQITLSSDALRQFTSLEIYSAAGQRMKSEKFNGQTTITVSLEHFPSGAYIIQLTGDQHADSYPFVVTK